MDLEISNASLLAINKTLERELRKQSAQLRRYKRLARSDRLSTAPSIADLRSTDLPTAESEITINGTEDWEVDDDDDEDTETEKLSEEEDDDDDDESSANDEKHRAQDEKRLTLDLSKHQA